MTVKPKRSYSSPRRARQAAETRAAVVAAARRLFVANGWQRTTIAAVAAAANVSSEMIYATFGGKRGLLEAALFSAARGADPDTPVIEQEGPRAVAAERSQRRQIALFAAGITEVLGRAAPVAAVIRAAAEAEPELMPLYEQLHRGRRSNLGFAADALLANGPLRAGLDRAAAVDILARLTSPELYLMMMRVERATPEQYAAWLERQLAVLLLEPA